MNGDETNSKPLPRRIKLLNWGVNESTEGPVVVNELTASIFAGMQRKIGRERAPLDFEHNTVPGTPEYERTHEPRDIAAMGAPLVIKGEGIFLDALDYKPLGVAKARDYEDVSAAPLLNKDRVVVGLHSAALTRAGAVYGAHFSAEDILKLAGEGITLAAFSSKISPSFTQPSTLKHQPNHMAEKLLSLAILAACMGLKPDADEASITNELTKRLKPDTEIAPLSALIKDGKVILVDTVSAIDGRLKKIEEAGTKSIAALSATIEGKVHTFSAEDVVKLVTRVEKLETLHATSAAAALDAERVKIVPLFAAEGRSPINPATKKAYTADELAKLDLPTLQVLHANTPVTVPLHARTRTGATEGKSELKGLAKAMAAHKAENNQ